MGRKPVDVVDRLRMAQARGRGTMLTSIEVNEVVDAISTMAQLYTALNQQAVQVAVIPAAVADIILDCLCWDESYPVIKFDRSEKGWSIWRTLDTPVGPADSFVTALDLWRNANGKDALDGVKVIIPGSEILAQVQASLNGA